MHLDPFADRTSAHELRANQLRAYFSAFAGVVIEIIRRFGLTATELEEGSVKDHPRQAAQDRKRGPPDDTPDLDLALLGVSLAVPLPEGRSQTPCHRTAAPCPSVAPAGIAAAYLERLRLPGHGEFAVERRLA